MKLHHFAIEVSDIDQSLEFYTQKLGFSVITPKKAEKDYFYANISLQSEVELELIQIKDKKRAKPTKVLRCPHLALESFDFDQDLKELISKGVEIFDGPHEIPGDVKIVTILDPDHTRIDIGQRL